jgi:hypothetical protein
MGASASCLWPPRRRAECGVVSIASPAAAFGGASGVTVAPGAEVVSDPVDIDE